MNDHIEGDENTFAIDLDTNGYGHIIVDQSDRESVFPARIILNQAQVKAIAEYAHMLSETHGET
jgi:hypothetical protein